MTSPHKNAWERLVAEVGLEEAKKEMSRRRAKVKTPNPTGTGGFGHDKEYTKKMSAKGVAKRRENYEPKE